LVINDEKDAKDAKVVLESEQGEESHGSGAELLHYLVRWSAGLAASLKREQQAKTETY